MRNLKRVLTLVMAVAMLMSLMVVGAGATAFPDDKDIKNTEAVQKMVSLNIIQGDEKGNFNPTGIVTRAEMSKMIATAMNGGVDPKLSSSSVVTASFTDTKGHWAEGYIEYCVNLGLVAGMGDDTFAPNQGVTATHAAKMTLVALGYDADFEKFVGTTWALNINKIAMQKGLYEDIQGIDPNAPMSRDNAAQMLSNFCSTLMVKYDFGFTGNTSGSVAGVKQAYDTTDTVLSKYFKLVPTTGTIANIGYDTKKKEFLYNVDSKNFASAEDFTALMGANVEVLWRNKDNNTASNGAPIYSASSDSVYDITLKNAKIMATGNMTDFGKYDTVKRTLVFAGTTYDVVNNPVNAVSAMDGSDYGTLNTYGTNNTGGLSNGAVKNTNPYLVTLLDNNDDGKLDKIVATPFTVQKVSYAGTSNSTFLLQGNHVAPAAAAGSVENADVTLYEGMKKDDIVAYYNASSVAEGKAEAVKMEIKTGTVNATRTGEVQIDGAWYDLMTTVTPKAGDKIDYAGVGSNIYFAKVVDYAATSKNVLAIYKQNFAPNSMGVDVLKANVMLGDGTKKTGVTIAKVDTIAMTTAPVVTANAIDGKMYSYKINSDNEYELTSLQDNSGSYPNTAGHDYVVEYALGRYNPAGKKVETTDGANQDSYELADNATVIWVNTDDDTAKMYNGKELKNNIIDSAMGTNATILADKQNGFTSATVVTIAHTSNPNVITGSNYGYLLSNPSMSVDSKGDSFHNYTLWTTKGQVEVKEKEVDSNFKFAKGDVISFDNDGEGLVKNAIKAPVNTSAVTGWDDNKKISIDRLGNSEVSKDDTTVLYINSSTFTGVVNGSITEAEPGYNNVYYIGNNTVLDLLVVDVTNRITVKNNAQAPAQADTNVKLDNLFTKTDGVEVTGNLTLTLDAAWTLPANKTLVVQGDLTLVGAHAMVIADGAELIVNGDLTLVNTFTVGGKVTADSIVDAGVANLAMSVSATGVLTLNNKISAAVLAQLETLTAGKIVLGSESAATAAATKWYTSAGSNNVDGVANTGTAGVAIASGAKVPAGTYTYGTVYTTNNGNTGTGWVKN